MVSPTLLILEDALLTRDLSAVHKSLLNLELLHAEVQWPLFFSPRVYLLISLALSHINLFDPSHIAVEVLEITFELVACLDLPLEGSITTKILDILDGVYDQVDSQTYKKVLTSAIKAVYLFAPISPKIWYHLYTTVPELELLPRLKYAAYSLLNWDGHDRQLIHRLYCLIYQKVWKCTHPDIEVVDSLYWKIFGVITC